MHFYGLETIGPLLASDHYLLKVVANETGAIFFPHTTEHRDAVQPGIQYADNYAGNALAAIVKPGRIEFRFHQQFSDERVRKIATPILAELATSFASHFEVTYKDRVIIPLAAAD